MLWWVNQKSYMNVYVNINDNMYINMAKHTNIIPLQYASLVRSGAVVKVAFETPNLFYFHFMLENEEIE